MGRIRESGNWNGASIFQRKLNIGKRWRIANDAAAGVERPRAEPAHHHGRVGCVKRNADAEPRGPAKPESRIVVGVADNNHAFMAQAFGADQTEPDKFGSNTASSPFRNDGHRRQRQRRPIAHSPDHDRTEKDVAHHVAFGIRDERQRRDKTRRATQGIDETGFDVAAERGAMDHPHGRMVRGCFRSHAPTLSDGIVRHGYPDAHQDTWMCLLYRRIVDCVVCTSCAADLDTPRFSAGRRRRWRPASCRSARVARGRKS